MIFLELRWLLIHCFMAILKSTGFILGCHFNPAVPERSKQVMEPSSPARPDSVSVLNSVPMGSRGCPTQPSMLVMEVWPL